MATSSSFFPRTDAGLLAWSANLSTLIGASPTTYGLTALQATNYQTLHDAYATALAAVEPGVRNKMNVSTKNDARKQLKDTARSLAFIIYGQTSLTDAQLIELGLTVRAAPSPIPPPADAPALDIVSVTGRTVKVRLHDSTDASRRGKPAGVIGAALFSFVGETAPVEISAWKFEGNTGQTIVEVVFASTLAPGAQVWVCAFWFNESKESGPACDAVGVQFGSAAMAA